VIDELPTVRHVKAVDLWCHSSSRSLLPPASSGATAATSGSRYSPSASRIPGLLDALPQAHPPWALQSDSGDYAAA
jgi:hypothetical protein